MMTLPFDDRCVFQRGHFSSDCYYIWTRYVFGLDLQRLSDI